MYSKFTLIVALLVFMLSGCNLTSLAPVPTPVPTEAPSLEFVQPTIIQPISPTQPIIIITTTPLAIQQVVLDRAAKVIAVLKDKDMIALAGYVHPQLGLHFSPYASVKDTDQVFSADKISGLMADSTVDTWGAYSGSGEPIELTYAEYYSKYVYDVDFANAPQMALNHRLGVSTTMDNSAEFYPGAMIVEYYFPGFDPQFEGMDWQSLRLVFMQDNNTWYLGGIIHDQWTP
jgi:hypothetical protein